MTVDVSDINLGVPLYLEKESTLFEMRKMLCKIKNDMLERLADYEPQQSISSLRSLPGVLTDNRFARLTWSRMVDNMISCDQQPDQIIYAIRLTLLAKSIKACHLPHFESLEYSHGLYQLKIKKPALSMREALEDEEFVQENGHMVIKGLLTMLLELRQVSATLHSLTPDDIFVSSQGTRLTVTNLFGITFKGMRVLNMLRGSMPYSN
jgi:hypothetical protein